MEKSKTTFVMDDESIQEVFNERLEKNIEKSNIEEVIQTRDEFERDDEDIDR